MPILSEIDAIRDLLSGSRTVAVLGAHIEAIRAAHYVPAYLYDQGYGIIPVNPHYLGQELWNHRVIATVGDIDVPVDIVNVFRPNHALPDHLPELLAMDPLPRAVWFQLGIRDDRVAGALDAAGIAVVQDRCTLADHRRWALGAPRRS